MPFREHRGRGKLNRAVEGMQGIWDEEWSEQVADPTECERSLNWRIVRDQLTAGGRVLEAGCGLGQWVKFLHDVGFEAHGIDFSEVGISQCQKLWPELQARFCLGDLRNMPYETASFDAIVSFGAIEHNEDGVAGPLLEMFRVLKPGGLLYCTVPAMNHLRSLGLMALQDWVVCNPTIRRLTGRAPEVSFYEYVFFRDEYRQAILQVGFAPVTLLPLEPMTLLCGGYHTMRYRVLERIHSLSPWTFAHMMAAVCRKPLEP